ncbi:MAG: hypothetical protein JXX14_12770 [Deltaproteobacteria bacterium]|nr:hypothetical protein [Deltaproteobacteria bacterium]
MKKILALLGLAGVFLFAGCSGSSSSGTTDSETVADSETVNDSNDSISTPTDNDTVIGQDTGTVSDITNETDSRSADTVLGGTDSESDIVTANDSNTALNSTDSESDIVTANDSNTETGQDTGTEADTGSSTGDPFENGTDSGNDSETETITVNDSDSDTVSLMLPPRTGIGINLNFPERGGTFVDVVKENYRWNTGGSDLTASQVDSKGWPKVDAQFVWDNRPVAEWAGEIDDPEEYRINISGTYKCSFKGQANVSGNSGGTVENLNYDTATNTTTFDFVIPDASGAGYGFVLIDFTETRRTASDTGESGFTDFKMYRPGYPPDTDKIFTDAFIAALQGIAFEAIRFMPFVGTNDVEETYPQVTEWAMRKLPDDASQSRLDSTGKYDAAAWEYVIALGNMLRKDIWICIPNSATEDYVRNLAQLIADTLDSDLNVYVENSNEVWNSIFPQQPWNLAQADDLGIGEHENHARRTVELADIFGEVMGQGAINTRIRPILCSHKPMLKWWVVPMLEYIRDNIGEPANYLYGIASQAYFSMPMEDGQSIADILALARDDIAAQIDETDGVNEAGRMQWITTAGDWGLAGGYFIYEGGGHPELGNLTNIDNVISAERDSGMGELLKYNYGDAFLELGGAMAMHFILSSAYTRYGSFGLTDDINFPERNHKYGALRDLAAAK